MCRALLYLGEPVLLDNFLYQPDSALVRQSTMPRMLNMLNLAGFGMRAWDPVSHEPDRAFSYYSQQLPVFDRNLKNLAEKIRTGCLLAHVRGVAYHTRVEISLQNCHPFHFKDVPLVMAHNGDLARVADDFESTLDRFAELVGSCMAVRIGELGDDQGVDPFAVGGAVDLRDDVRLEVREEEGLHLREASQVAVVRHHQRHVLEVERVAVLQGDLDARVVGDATHVGEEAAGADFLGEVLEVAVEDREPLRVVGEGAVGLVAHRVPGSHSKAGEVEHVQHAGHGGLPYQRRVGLVEEVVEQHRLAEVEQRAAHLRDPRDEEGDHGDGGESDGDVGAVDQA